MEPQTEHSSYHRLKHSRPERADFVVVNWCLGNTCNFSCSYCPKDLHCGSNKWPDLELVKQFCDKIFTHFHKHKRKLYFEFTGGEVTLWKDLPQLFQHLKQQGARVGLISNGSRTDFFWQKLLPLIDHVCLSFHPEHSDSEHFLKIVRICSEAARTHANFMMHPEHFPKILALAYRVKDIPNVSLAFQPLLQDFSSALYPYSSAQLHIIETQNVFLAQQIRRNKVYETYRGDMAKVFRGGREEFIAPQRLIASGQNSWRGWFCSAGLEQIVVNMHGDVFRGWCTAGGQIGNVFRGDIHFPKRAIVCPKDFCHCNLDIMTTKVRPGLKAKVLSFVGFGADKPYLANAAP